MLDPACISGEALKGVSVLYGYELDALGSLTARLGRGRVNPEAKSLSMGRAGALASLTHASDLITSSAFASANAMLGTTGAGWSGPAVFSALSGGTYRHTTGSHADVDSLSGLLGLAWRNNGPQGALLVGMFGEFGYADHETRTRGVTGSGHSTSAGFGLMARYDFTSDWYADASARIGRSRLEFDSGLADFLGNQADYTSNAVYYGTHLRTGYVWQRGCGTVDLSAAWLWSRLGSDSVKAAGDPVRFAHSDSHRFRLGGRYSLTLADERFSPYAGAYYEYEAKGKSKGSAYGYAYGVPSLKGSTGIGELGVAMRSRSFPDLSADLGVQGSLGRRQGVSGTLRLGWRF